MNELSLVAQRTWLIISACIIAVMAVCAIAVVGWWFVENCSDYLNKKKRAEHYRATEYASAADAGWSSYLDMKNRYDYMTNEYELTIERRDKKIASMEEWELKRIERIKQLEDQLRENGIEPCAWEKEKREAA